MFNTLLFSLVFLLPFDADAHLCERARIHTAIHLFIGNRVKAIKWKIALSSFDFNITPTRMKISKWSSQP